MQRPDPSDSGRARGLDIGRQGATDFMKGAPEQAGSPRERLPYRALRRQGATEAAKGEGGMGVTRSTRTSSVGDGGSWVDPTLLS